MAIRCSQLEPALGNTTCLSMDVANSHFMQPGNDQNLLFLNTG